MRCRLRVQRALVRDAPRRELLAADDGPRPELREAERDGAPRPGPVVDEQAVVRRRAFIGLAQVAEAILSAL